MSIDAIHPTDTLRPGDLAVLTRRIPAGYEGPNRPARTLTLRLRVGSLTRLDSVADLGPRWCFEADTPDPDRRGAWSIGRERGGLMTTLLPAGTEDAQ